MKKTSREIIKYTFSEEEKRDIAITMAQKVGDLKRLDDDFKASKSQFKSQMDLVQAEINLAADRLNTGFEMKTMEVDVDYDFASKMVHFYRMDTQELVKSRKMQPDELQMELELEA